MIQRKPLGYGTREEKRGNTRSFSVLLTGATGFLGSHLCRALLAKGHSVSALCRSQSDFTRLGNLAPRIRWYQLPAEMEAPFLEPRVPDVVIHSAVIYGRKGESASEMMGVNLALPVRLCELASEHGVPWFLNTDTVLPAAVSTYAFTKHQASELLKFLRLPIGVFNLKLQHFFGGGDDPGKFITSLIRKCATNVPEILLTEGRQCRDFIYISDVVEAILALLEHLQPRRNSSQGDLMDLDIGSGKAVEVRHVVEQIHSLARSHSRLVFGAVPLRKEEPLFTCAETRQMLPMGWQPRIGLEEGLRLTVQSETERIAKGN
jgi:CDP-paratose synthetase